MKHRLPRIKDISGGKMIEHTRNYDLPICHLDELYDNNIIRYSKYLKQRDKLCPYRHFDLDTEQTYCMFSLGHRKELTLKDKIFSMNYEELK